ncbi:MAG: type IV pilus assembly protein PilB [Verrucomicrobia bacterium]|jgi:type IV pilus assembly protein PilB|nr:MAG: type IV pilus assembly protein PilB [Verrucomicrobiota bacterium]
MNADTIIDLLVNRELLSTEQGEYYLAEARQTGTSIVDTLESHQLITKDGLYNLIAEDIGGVYYDLSGFEPSPQIVATVPAGIARLHQALPIQFDETSLYIALVDPLDPNTVEDLRFSLNQDIRIVVAEPARILELINKSYAEKAPDDFSDVMSELNSLSGSNDDLEAEANSAPIIRYVDLVLFQAIKERASDIHFEPFEDDFKIRYRVDGALYEMAPPPQHLQLSITSRIKVMSNLNIAERRLPQDGRIMKTIGGQPIDMRVSTLPTQFGESVVLRVLDRSSVNLDLNNLNLPPYIAEYIEETIIKPNGIFVCTGPTGAGKTTTLYACLRKINTIDTKILTAEDPVEYDIDGIIQVPVNEAIGLNFGRVLRAFLRQDPDRILVGEMRDLETAQIAIQASLTGHLVFSTLHTNDAPGAVTRLVDMGCEPFLVAATMQGVLAQRLLRTICPNCKVPYPPNDTILSKLKLTRNDVGSQRFYTGAGCPTCNNTGYKGRQGLFELLDMNDTLRDLVTQRVGTVVLKQKAIEMGMKTLREDGLRCIFEGITTIEEVLKYT